MARHSRRAAKKPPPSKASRETSTTKNDNEPTVPTPEQVRTIIERALSWHLNHRKGLGDHVLLDGDQGNLQLITSDPLLLRYYNTCLGLSYRSNLEALLESFWHEAAKYLYLNRIENDRLVTESDLNLYERYDMAAGLTDAQQNALEVLRCVRRIKEMFYDDVPVYDQSQLKYDPIGWGTNCKPYPKHPTRGPVPVDKNELYKILSEHLSRLAIEMMLLVLAAVKCDLYSFMWSDFQRGAKQVHDLGKKSKMGNERRWAHHREIQNYLTQELPKYDQVPRHQRLGRLKREIKVRFKLDRISVSDKKLREYMRNARRAAGR